MLRLRLYQCSISNKGIDLLKYLKDYDFDPNFPHVEWNQYMREDNFHQEWAKEWKSNSDSTDEENDND